MCLVAGLVAEAVPRPARDLPHAPLDGRQQDDVLQLIDAGGGSELPDVTRPEHAVIHRRIPARNEPPGRRRGRAHDYLVLRPRLGQPRLDSTPGQKSEKRITLNKDARVECIREDPSHSGFTGPGRPGHHEEKTHGGILARPEPARTLLTGLASGPAQSGLYLWHDRIRRSGRTCPDRGRR